MTRTDPHDPDYVPPYTGQDGRDVGSGDRFGGDLYALYSAGQLHIPTTAGHYSQAAAELHYVQALLESIASQLPHPVGHAIARRAEDVYDALRLSTKRLYDAGETLVLIADDYAKTDQEARDQFAGLLERDASLFDNPPARHDPPRPGDPPTVDPDDVPEEEDLDQILEDADIEDQLADDDAEEED
ncbi:hypothetical protein [Nocardioides gansuensis]|nr:hypothetical protein [Nocardioides gansuensis]